MFFTVSFNDPRLAGSRATTRAWYSVLVLCLLCFPLSAAEFSIQGVDDDRLRQNIRLHLNNLTVEPGLLSDPFWREEVANTVATAVQPFGYYNSETTISVEEDESVTLQISLNTPLQVANVTREIIGEGREDKAFRKVFNDFALKPGDTLVQPVYESFKSSMFNYALAHGYFDFRWQATRLDLVREQREANIVLIAQSGPRYEFGEVQLVGDDRAEAIIERLTPFKQGEPYSSEKLTEFNRKLSRANYFSRVIARPVVSDAEGLQVPIEVSVVHKPRDEFNVGLGAATDTGPRLRLQWARPWVNSRGHAVSSEIFVSQPEQSLTVDYRIPMADISNDYLGFQAGYQFIEYENTDTKSETLSLAAHRYWHDTNSPWQQEGSLTYLREMYEQGNEPPQTTQLVLPGYALTYLDKDDPITISKGTYFQAFIQAGREGVGSDIDMAKAVIEGKLIRTFGDHRLMLRGEVGAIKTNDFSRVPASVRFFAGGDQSVRGFEYRDISPKDTVVDPVTGEEVSASVGGKYLFTSSVEYAYSVAENWRVAVFTDVGTATNEMEGDFSYGVGTGFHWLSPIGPVRVYVARGFAPSPMENSWGLHFILAPEL